MRFLELIKEIWKQNRREYLISGVIVILGCLFFYAKNKAPLEYSIPFGLVGLTFFMFMFGLFIGGKE